MKKLYLDVDGVLLTTKNKRMADNVASFVSYIVENFDCYWLTTHCRDGNTRNVLNVLSHYLPNNIILQLQAVKPTVWDSMKPEVIDFDSDFYWVDDYIFNTEKDILCNHNCYDRLFLVNLNNQGELLNIIEKLKKQD